MRLERLALHRLTRIVAGVLPFVIAILVAIPLWDYLARARDARPPEEIRHEPLPEGIAVQAKRLMYVVHENGDPIYSVAAAEMVESTENTKSGNNVDVEIYPRKAGDPTRRIHGDRCGYDLDTKDILCTGNVWYQLNEKTFGRTEELRYIHAGRVIESVLRTDIEQPGRMNGDAGHLAYLLDSDTLNLTGDVHIHLTQGGRLNGGKAVFNQNENWAAVSEGIEVQSPNGWIRGASGRAELEPGSYRPTRVTVEKSVTAESAAATGPDKWKLHADWLQSDLSAEGNIQNVLARTNAKVDRTSPAGDESLTGAEITGRMDASGRLSHVEAIGAPEFEGEKGRLTAEKRIGIDPGGTITTEGVSVLDPRETSGAAPAEAGRVTAETGMVINPKGTITTQGRSTLKASDADIRGRDFVIEQKPDLRLFQTKHRAVLSVAGRQTEGDSTTLQLDVQTNQLRELVHTGNVTFKEGAREGEAGKLVVTNGGDKAVLEGAARITDGPILLSGRQITLDRKQQTIEGIGDVVTIDSTSRKQLVTVHAGRVRAGDDSFEYWDFVRVFRDGGEIRADHVKGNKDGKGFNADGNVVSRNQTFEARAQSLEFTETATERSARYLGKVWAQKKGKQIMTLETADMKVLLTPAGDVASIESKGGVIVTQGTNVGTGVEAVYVAATGQSVLQGSDTVDAVVKGNGDSARGYLIRTDSTGRVASIEPSKIDGRGNLSTDRDRLKK